MAIEVGKFLGYMLSQLPEGHPDRLHVEGLAKVNQAYLAIEGRAVFSELWDEAIEVFNRKLENPDYKPRPFGEMIAEYRHRLGMNQRVMASRMEYDATHWNKVEAGTRKPPVVEKALLLFQNLYLSPSDAVELSHAGGYSPQILRSLKINISGTTYPERH